MQFNKVQELVSNRPGVLPNLLWRYRELLGSFFTRDLRLILEECICPERLDLVYDRHIFCEENKLLLLQPKIGMEAFANDFYQRVLKYFDQEVRIPQERSDMHILAVEDRKVCFEREFRKFQTDNGYSFLLAVRDVLQYEAHLLQNSTQPPPQISLLKRSFSSTTVSERSIVLTEFKKQILDATDPNRMQDIRTALKAFNESDFLTGLSIDRVFEPIDDLIKHLTTSFKRGLVNDQVQHANLDPLNQGFDLDKVLRASKLVDKESAFNDKITELFSKSLIVLNQSCQVIRERKYLKFEIQLLFGNFFSQYLGFESFIIAVALLNEADVCRLDQQPAEAIPLLQKLAHEKQLSFRDQKQLNLSQSNNFSTEISLQVAKLPLRKNPVWAQKFAFCFFVQNKESHVHCLSRPVTFITNDNQRMDSAACIAYENTFPMPVRSGFDVLKSIDGTQCVEMIDRYFFEETCCGLSPENRSYFTEKCNDLFEKQAFCITFDDILKVQFIGAGKTMMSLWGFVYTCVKFIKDHALKLWRSGLIYGFITKAAANDVIRKLLEHGVGDFALLRFSETTATVTVCYSTTDGCAPGFTKIQNMTPKPDTHFSSVPLAKFCDDPLSPLTMIVTRDGSLEKSAVLREMIPKEENVPGYVPLRKRGASDSNDTVGDLTSSIASVTVFSPTTSEFSTVAISPLAQGGDLMYGFDGGNSPIPDAVIDLCIEHIPPG